MSSLAAVVPGARDAVAPGARDAVAPGARDAVAPVARDTVAPGAAVNNNRSLLRTGPQINMRKFSGGIKQRHEELNQFERGVLQSKFDTAMLNAPDDMRDAIAQKYAKQLAEMDKHHAKILANP